MEGSWVKIPEKMSPGIHQTPTSQTWGLSPIELKLERIAIFGAVEGKTLDELRAVLDVATEEELQQITQILFCRKLNPLDYFGTPEPTEIQSKERSVWLDAIEERFRFLAADGMTVLRQRTHQISYRQVLIRVCHYLKIPYRERFSTVEIEAEIFLHLVDRAWQRLPKSQQNSLLVRIQRSLESARAPEPLPPRIQQNPLGIVLKGSSAVVVSSVLKPWLLQQIAKSFALHFASYQVAKQAIVAGGAAATRIQSQVALQMAQRQMAVTAARYGAARTVFAIVGPLLWGWLALDLGWKAIATNYGRIIPTVFAIAQIRLTREETWELA